MANPPLGRTIRSIQGLVDQEEWYAAHQKYRTSAARLLKSSDPASVNDAASLLFEGARLLLQRNQTGSGTDLALMLIRDVYASKGLRCRPDERNRILNLIALAGPSGTWRKTIIDAAVAWSAEAGECPTGDPALHLAVGETLSKENQLHASCVHLLSACNQDSARVLSDVMWTWSKQEHHHAANLGQYAAVGVVGFLELGSILAARTFLDAFLSKASSTYPKLLSTQLPCPLNSSSIQVYTHPALNFLQLLILTCQVGAGSMPNGSQPPPNHTGPTIGKAVYQAMVGRYSRVEGWMASPVTKEVYTTLGEMYFGIRPPRQSGNIFNDLMGSLFSRGGPPSLPEPLSRNSKPSHSNSGGITAPALD